MIGTTELSEEEEMAAVLGGFSMAVLLLACTMVKSTIMVRGTLNRLPEWMYPDSERVIYYLRTERAGSEWNCFGRFLLGRFLAPDTALLTPDKAAYKR